MVMLIRDELNIHFQGKKRLIFSATHIKISNMIIITESENQSTRNENLSNSIRHVQNDVFPPENPVPPPPPGFPS